MNNDILLTRQNKNLLFDFYGGLLTKKQRDVFAMHVIEDCSLSEIGKEFGITPQAVADILRRATAQLDKYEVIIGMVQKFEIQQQSAKDIEVILSKLDNFGIAEVSEHAGEIRALLNLLCHV